MQPFIGTPKSIYITAKVGDLINGHVYDINDTVIISFGGVVPEFFPSNNYGEYLNLEIELETGKILNWIPPTKEQINEFIMESTEECDNEDCK